MKHAIVICASMALFACSDSTGTWLRSDQTAAAAHVGGSAADTTTAFDGTYKGTFTQSAHISGTGLKVADPNPTPCQVIPQQPTLTITNGLAQFEALGVTFSGYVTPQGHLTMHSGYGATVTGQVKPVQVDEDFDGDFDTVTHVLSAKVSSVNCSFRLSWQKVA